MTSQKFGASTVIDFDPATGGYKLTNTEGETISVAPSDRPSDAKPGVPTFRKTEGGKQHDIVIGTPVINNVAFTYSRVVAWNVLTLGFPPNNRFQFHVIGVPTKTEDMPKTGSGSYDISGGIGVTSYDPVTMTGYNFQPKSTGSFDINFGSGAITQSLRMIGIDEAGGKPDMDLGTYTGSGTLTAGGPAFSGTFAGGPSAIASSAFEGAFFGPGATEMNYVMHIDTSRVDLVGTVSGRKK